jgi:hypothetical protein
MINYRIILFFYVKLVLQIKLIIDSFILSKSSLFSYYNAIFKVSTNKLYYLLCCIVIGIIYIGVFTVLHYFYMSIMNDC